MDKVLFLDDMETRHKAFRQKTIGKAVVVYEARTAAEAIKLLGEHKFVQVFLDHDLSEEDIMVAPDGESSVPTGMDVVKHIMTMEDPPPDIILHTCNGPASELMFARLNELQGVSVRQVPFPTLLHLLQ